MDLNDTIQAALNNYSFDLDQLPIEALRRKLNSTQQNDGDTTMLPHSIGVDSLANIPAARFSRVAAQAIPNNISTALSGDTIDFDTGGMTNLGPTRLTAPVDGIYMATAYSGMSPAAGGIRQVLIQKNGATLDAAQLWEFNAAAPVKINVCTSLLLKRGDYVEALLFQTSGAGIFTENTGGPPHLSLTFLSNYLTES